MGTGSLGLKLRLVWSSLAFRVALLLTLSIVPIGAIAFYQTSLLSETLEEQSARALLASTVKATSAEQIAIERSLGAALVILQTLKHEQGNGAECSERMTRAIDGSDGYTFVGLLSEKGLSCSSGFAAWEPAQQFAFDPPKAFVTVADTPRSSVLLGHPVGFADGTTHYVLLEAAAFAPERQPIVGGRRPEAITYFDTSGTVLRTTRAPETMADLLPTDLRLDILARGDGTVFHDEARAGDQMVYSVIPVSGDYLFALAVWDPSIAAMSAGIGGWSLWVSPVLMWLATLAFAYLAINRLVVRHVQHLGKQMRRFARNKVVPSDALVDRQPAEFREMNKNFRAMAEAIVHDEAELENAVHEKTLLLREVHHRVKNNLQLIASIMNMQIRRSKNDETTWMLRRLQDRVLGLAAVHRQMYRATSLDQVPVEEVLGAVLTQVVRPDVVGPMDVTYELEPMSLTPDQAVPLALLTAEAATNALNHIDSDVQGAKWLSVRLTKVDDRKIELEIRNSVSLEAISKPAEAEPNNAGLGAQLIEAFVRQLGGDLIHESGTEEYKLKVSFLKVEASTTESDRARPETAAMSAGNDNIGPATSKEGAASLSG